MIKQGAGEKSGDSHFFCAVDSDALHLLTVETSGSAIAMYGLKEWARRAA